MFKSFISYVVWIPLAILETFMSIIAYPLVPFVTLTAIGKNDLPWFLSWFGTHDNGIDGDSGHHERWANWIKWTEEHHLKNLGIYVKRVAWMWRNKMYNFSYYVTGRVIETPIKWCGNPNVADDNNGDTGYLILWNKRSWCIWVWQPWLKIGSYQFYFRIYLGWKFKGEAKNNPQKEQREMLVFFFSPFRYKKV